MRVTKLKIIIKPRQKNRLLGKKQKSTDRQKKNRKTDAEFSQKVINVYQIDHKRGCKF